MIILAGGAESLARLMRSDRPAPARSPQPAPLTKPNAMPWGRA